MKCLSLYAMATAVYLTVAAYLLSVPAMAAPTTAPTSPALQQIAKLIATGQCQKAVTEVDRFLKAQPDSGMAHYYRAQALEKIGSRADAIAEYEMASLLEPLAKFAPDCQAKMKALSVPESELPATSSILNKKGKQVSPFKLRGEQTRVITEVSNEFKQQLKDDVSRLHELAESGPSSLQIAAGPRLPRIPLGVSGQAPQTPMQLASSLNIPAGNLSEKEKEKLSKYDVIFIVDHSGSMNSTDCPMNTSRWDWLAAQVYSIGRDAQDCFPRGVKIVMFDDNAEEYMKATPKEFVELFKYYGPEGGTNTGYAFRTQLRYVQAKLNQQKPVLMVGITDGLPNNPAELQQAFQELRQMAARTTTPLKVSLLQIGASDQGLKTLSQLETLTGRGIYTAGDKTFVQVHSFAELTRYGLPRTLMNILNN